MHTEKDAGKLEHQRHTLAHLLGAAVLKVRPEAQLAIGPAIADGFYYDVDFGDTPISEKDLPKIEKEMWKMLPSWKNFSAKEVSADEAKTHFKDNPYKLELIEEIVGKGEKITLYTAGALINEKGEKNPNSPHAFTDLCRGGHSENPAEEITPDSFKLDRIAGAYWRGDEKNHQLTRIYGLAFATKAELDAHITAREEAEKRDHRKLGKELGLFVFSDMVGKGLPLWTEKGATVRRELERFIVDEEIRRGYRHVYTPDLAKLDLYKKSGHYPYYKDSMYAPIQIDDEEFMLRPMTCPHHFELYLSKPHSYKELPVRIAELAKLYRYEQSGELSGLVRVRGFCLADAHIICADAAQAKQEVNGALDLIEYIAHTFGLKMGQEYWYRLSLGNRANTEKYFKDDAAWDEAEQKLREVLRERLETHGAHFVEVPDEAAFYGPKIDIQMRDVRGKENTAFTVQYDFVMPKRFHLTYTAADGSEKEPIVIHRSSIGAIERLMAFLIEHYAGAFPLWLSPIQVKVLPIGEAHQKFAAEVTEKIKAGSVQTGSVGSMPIRAELDINNESLGKKVRAAKVEKIPYWLVIGDKELAAGEATLESRDHGPLGSMSIEKILEKLQVEICEKK